MTPLGKRIWVTWNEQKIASFRDESGRTVTYQYEGELLTAVTHVNEGVMEYGYDANGYLNQIIDQNGKKFLRNEYDREGRIKKQYLSNGESYTMSYDLSKKKTTVYYSGLDREDVVSYNAERLPIQIEHGDGTKESYEYEEGYRTKKKDKRGNETKWSYDAFGRVRTEHFADGYEKYYEYDEQDDLVKEWDNEQEAIWYEYDAHHNKIKEIQQVREGKVRERCYAYDRRGRLRKSTNALGVSILYQYHPNEGAPYYVKNGKGEETYYEYDILGRRVAVKNAYGRVEYGYNQKNLVTSYKDGEGNESHKLYDRLDNLIVYYPPKAWKEKSKGWHYRYDSLDRRIETITPLEEHYRTYRDGEGYIQKEIHPNAYQRGAQEEAGVSYEHDKGHHRIRIYSPEGGIERRFYDEEGNLIKQVLPEQYEKERDDGEGYTYCYDVRNRLTAVYAPDGTKEKEYFYDGTGRVVKEISGGSREKRYQYDGLGHVIEERESLRREGETVWYRGKENVYDAEGNLVIERYGTKEIREEEPLTEYEEIRYFYDENGHVERIEDGYGAYEKYAYDCLGNRIYEERLIEEGIVQKIRYRYDKAGRCIEKKEYQMGNGTSAPAVTRYGYDENGNIVKVITPNGKEKRYAYDACNRLIEERTIDKPNGIDRVVFYSYDKAGNVTKKEVGGKREARASYQKENYTYNYEDQAVEKTNACGGRYAYFYDKNQQVIEVREPEQKQGTRYRYDNRGNVVEVRDALGIRREERNYNEQNELIKERDAYGKEVGYRYREDGVLLGVETERSKREGRERQAYEYNARGQLIGLKDGNGNQTEYKRDGWGRIGTIKKADHSEEHYEYYPSGKLKRRVDAKGNEVRYHYNSQGKLRKRIDESGGEEEYFYDGEGNVTLKIDRNGSRIERSYTVDGNVVWQRARKVTGEESTTKYTYNERGEVETASKGGYCYRYLYTKGGKLKEKREGGRLLFGCAYNARGQLSSLTDETGKRSEYLYDKLGRLERIRLEEGKEIRYTYDKKDRIQVI